jgi:polar amino acid transport system permease protein
MDILDTFFNWTVFQDSLPLLLLGLTTTLSLGVTSILIGLVTGLFLALIRMYAPAPAALLAVAYIDLFRAIPILVLLVLIYYALPFVGLRLSPFAAATSALSLVSCAYAAEIFRAGIQAVPSGQFEASRALGLRYWSMMTFVILPQSFRIVIPPITNNCINVMKDTALASVVAMPDLLKQATQAQALAANPTPLVGAALIYLLMLLPMVRIVGTLERRFAVGRQR